MQVRDALEILSRMDPHREIEIELQHPIKWQHEKSMKRGNRPFLLTIHSINSTSTSELHPVTVVGLHACETHHEE